MHFQPAMSSSSTCIPGRCAPDDPSLFPAGLPCDLESIALICGCRRPVTVDVYSIGMFKFKGVMGMYNVVQIMPALLADRNEHIPASLPRGKATCVTRDIEKLSTVTVYLPDYEQPQLHAGHNESHADTVQTPVGSMTNSPAASLLVPIGIA